MRERRHLHFGNVVLLLGFAVLLCLPMLAGLPIWRPGRAVTENRRLTALPPLPQDWAEMVAYPTALTAYIGDHYGLRGQLVALNGTIRWQMFGEFVSDQVWLGQHGRLLYISHSAKTPFSLIDRICGNGVSSDQVKAAATGMATLLREGMQVTPSTYYVSVPTTPVIDHQDLPTWLARRCDQAGGPFVPRMQAALAAQDPALAPHLLYPRAALEAARRDGRPYPIWNFHWSGEGARPVTEAIAGGTLGLPRRTPLPLRTEWEPSDLTQFTPGVKHRDLVPQPDHKAAGVSFCYGGGGACVPGLAPFAHAITEISASTSPAGPSVLVISDSFGRLPAQYLGAYFGRMLHLNIAFDRLAPGELAQLARQIAVEAGHPDVLLFIFHDAAAIDAGGLAGPFATIAAALK